MRDAQLRPATVGVFLFLSAALLTAAGCKDDHHHYGPRTEQPRVKGIEVDEYDTIGSHLEIEVHLYDARNGRLLGCSGDDTGLAHVDHANTHYNTNAHFVQAGHHHHRLTAHDVEGRDLFVRVYEDDHSECPSPPGSVDDFIGQSPIFPVEDLYRGIVMEFDDVLYLELAMY